MSIRSESSSRKSYLREIYENHQRKVVGLVSVIIFLSIWQFMGQFDSLMSKYMSSPTATLGAGWVMLFDTSFWQDISVSLQEFGLGFLLAVVVGLIFGLGMGVNKRFCYLLEPLIMAMNATPRMALIPIILLWFGIGLASKIVVVFLGAVIPIMINTMVGIQSVDSVLLRAAESFGAKKRDVYFKILFPGSVPSIMAGIKLGLGRGLLGMIIAEMYVSVSGVGNAIMIYGQAIRVNELIFMIALVSFFGFSLVSAVGKLEKRLCHWKHN